MITLEELARNRTALLLGAGFSYELGLPLVTQLTKELLMLAATPEPLVREYGKRAGVMLLNSLEEILANHLPDRSRHYEALVGYLEEKHAGWFRADSQAPNEYPVYAALRFWITDMVYELLAIRHFRQEEIVTRGVRLYRAVAELAEKCKPLWVFSLNHDICLELICASYSVPPLKIGTTTRFEFVRGNGKVTLARLQTAEEFRAGTCLFQEGEFGTNIVPLHGRLLSFTALNKEKGKVLWDFVPQSNTVDGWLEALDFVEQCGKDEGETHVDLNNIVIPWDQKELILSRTILSGTHKLHEDATFRLPPSVPAWSPPKMDGVGALLGENPAVLRFSSKVPEAGERQDFALEAFEIFEKNLAIHNSLLIIGYSFGDEHVNKALKAWLTKSSERFLINVSPAAGIPDEFSGFSGQIHPERQGAVDFLLSLVGGETRKDRKVREFIRSSPQLNEDWERFSETV